MTKNMSIPQAAFVNAAWLPLAAGTTLQWDASSGLCRDVELSHVLEHGHLPSFRVTGAPLTVPQVRPYWTSGEISLVPVYPSPRQEAASIIFSMAATLLANNDQEATSGSTAELAWFPSQQQTESPTSSVYPVLLGHVPGELPQRERITIVPFLQACDPLQRHIALVLQTAIAVRNRAEQLSAEALAEALMVHFLRRYAASQLVLQEMNGGLVPYKLQRTLAYIQAHLTQKLSLGTLADVAQISPTHFAHLFKRATGLAPHRYVILSRIEHAKRLLGETDMPLIDIGPEAGFSDQSHFTALFRKHVSMTPKTYRDATARV